MPVQTVIKVRRDTAANWISTNPVLASGEMGLETDTELFKFGNGTATWTALAYSSSSRTTQIVKNDTGASAAKGSVVYISGANGSNALFSLADADAEATSSKTVGLLAQTLAINGIGAVVTEGLLSGVNTGTATAGQSVWLSSTAGQFVFNAPPAKPAHSVYLGVVTRAHSTQGEILVKVQNGYELEELHNVNITTPDPGSSLIWDDVTSMWIDKKLTVTDTLQDSGVPQDGYTILYDLGASGWTASPLNAGPNYAGRVKGSTDGQIGSQSVSLGGGAAAAGASSSSLDSIVAVGQNAMNFATTTAYTVSIGSGSMALNNPGDESVAIGFNSLQNDMSTGGNVAVGSMSSYNNETGSKNVAVGKKALFSGASISNTVAVGFESGGTGSNNVFLGYMAGKGSTASNKLYIANSNTSTPLIYGEFDTAKLDINGSLLLKQGTREKFYTTTTALNGDYYFDVLTNGSIQYLSTASTGHASMYFRGSSTVPLNTLMSVGESLTITFLVTNGATAYRPVQWRTDNGYDITMKWLGAAPTSGNANAIDAYTVTLVKTGDNAFLGFGSASKFV